MASQKSDVKRLIGWAASRLWVWGPASSTHRAGQASLPVGPKALKERPAVRVVPRQDDRRETAECEDAHVRV